MTVRADWFTPEATRAEIDPFADDPTTGTRFDLRDPQALLQALLHQEGELAEAGTECDLKWNGQACSTCTVNRRGEDTPMGRLCSIGLRQEETLAEI